MILAWFTIPKYSFRFYFFNIAAKLHHDIYSEHVQLHLYHMTGIQKQPFLIQAFDNKTHVHNFKSRFMRAILEDIVMVHNIYS